MKTLLMLIGALAMVPVAAQDEFEEPERIALVNCSFTEDGGVEILNVSVSQSLPVRIFQGQDCATAIASLIDLGLDAIGDVHVVNTGSAINIITLFGNEEPEPVSGATDASEGDDVGNGDDQND